MDLAEMWVIEACIKPGQKQFDVKYFDDLRQLDLALCAKFSVDQRQTFR